MKIMIINPDYGMTRGEMDARCAVLGGHVGPDVSLAMQCLAQSEVYLDSVADGVMAGPEILRMAIRAEAEGYDAVVLYCFSDPAVEACRELLRIPVIGGGQGAYLMALTVSRQFGVLVSDAKRIPEKRLFAHQTGIDAARACAFEAPDLQGKGIREDTGFTVDCLAEAAGRMIRQEGIQAVVLGCLSYLGMADSLAARLGLPVIDAAIAAVAMAEALVRAGLGTSKAAYPLPPRGKRQWQGGEVDVP